MYSKRLPNNLQHLQCNENLHNWRPWLRACAVCTGLLTGFAAFVQPGAPFFTGITKLNLATGGVEATWAPPDHFPCEPIFVPRPGGTAEDDGVVLSVVLLGIQ